MSDTDIKTVKETPKKESYTDRLIQHLKECGETEFTIKRIKDFSKTEGLKFQLKNEKEKENFTWGKYKGKTIKDVFKLDESYCEWALRSNYLSVDKKLIISDLFSNHSST